MGAWGVFGRDVTTPPDAILGLAFVDSAGGVTFQNVEFNESEWAPHQPLTTKLWDGVATFTIVAASSFSTTWDPVRRALVSTQAVDDDGVIEMFEHLGGSAPVRIAPGRGDDQEPSLSPDGTKLLFSTARWDSLSHNDIALYSLKEGSVRRLTDSPDSDLSPAWSPSGTRVAFARNPWDGSVSSLCVLELATLRTECRDVLQSTHELPTGWLDEDRIVVLESGSAPSRLAVRQWSTNERFPVTEAGAERVRLSPDGRWAYCNCTSTADGSVGPVVFPLAAPSLMRRVVTLERQPPADAFWIKGFSSPEGVVVRIDTAWSRTIPPGVPTQLTAGVRDARGREVASRGSIRWAAPDSIAVRVDSVTGVITATGAAKQFIVRASVGSSASDSIYLSLDEMPTPPLFIENWSDTTFQSWIRYGKPLPKVATGPDGIAAFLSNGDGSFSSGALTRSPFNASRGLSVEGTLSTPLTRSQWQIVGVGLRQISDSIPFSQAAGHNGVPAFPPLSELCDLSYPIERTRSSVGFGAGAALHFDLPSADWISGRWHSYRIQLFPDGRCGLALDGKPVALLRAANKPRGSVRLIVGGNSVGAQMLIGPLQVHEGVLRDIDWTKVPVVR
jgi:hypothetical protein